MRHDVGERDVLQHLLAGGRVQGDLAVPQLGDPRAAVHPDAVRRQDLLEALVRSGEPQRRGSGQDEMDVEVAEHAGAAPVVARHEERQAPSPRTARAQEDSEEHASGAQVPQDWPDRGRGVVVEGRGGPAGGVGVREAGRRVPVLVQPGAHDQRGRADAAPRPGDDGGSLGVDGDHLVADRVQPSGSTSSAGPLRSGMPASPAPT